MPGGRPPRPTKLKLLMGETKKSRLNEDEPQPRDALPLCPDTVAPAVREVWEYAVAEMLPMKILTPADRDVLLCYCEAVVNHRKASELLAKSNVIIKGDHGGPVRNPALQVQRDSALLIHRLGADLGLTPAGRSRIRVSEAGLQGSSEDNPYASAASGS